MKLRFLIFSLWMGGFACGGKKTSPMNPEAARDFTRYLTENNLMPAADEKHLYVLLHPGYCGSCTEAIQTFVKKELERCTLHKTLIFSSDRQDVTVKFAAIPGLRIIKDVDGRLGKYGLANGLELYMVLYGGKMEAFGPINTETVDDLRLCTD